MHTQQVAEQIQHLLANTSVTFATIAYTTRVKTAAAYAHINVQKHTVANVQLFANLSAAADVYARAVKRSAKTHLTNDQNAVAEFTAQSNYFAHTDCWSIVQHKNNNNLYLYCIYNRARSTYTINNVAATKQQVAELLTASAAAQLLQPSNTVQLNVAHNITHGVVVRTIALQNIKQVRARRQQVEFV